MYSLLAVLAGLVVSVMVLLNGSLSQAFGLYVAAALSHVVGVLFGGIVCALRREKLRSKGRAPLWAYMGGFAGVLTLLFCNFSFGRLSMVCIVALGLLGQSLASMLLDGFGWLGTEKRPINRSTLLGFLLALPGVVLMLDSSVTAALPAVLLSMGAGVTVAFSRAVNARLAKSTSPAVSSFINHLVGLPVCVLLAFTLQEAPVPAPSSPPPWIFLGGILGVLTVLLYNITVPRLSAIRLSLLSFLGQIFAGLGLDLLLGQGFSHASFRGGIFVAGGLLVNMAWERWDQHKKQKQERVRIEVLEAETLYRQKVLSHKT